MAGITEQQFLESVRNAIGKREPAHDYPTDHEVARVVKAGADLVERFCAMVVDAKMKLYRVRGEAAVPEVVVGILKQAGAASALVVDLPFPKREETLAALRAAGIRLENLQDHDAAFKADFGIVPARLGIAETGSISIQSGPKTRRLASLAVVEHVAILKAESIVPDLLDWADSLGTDPPANEVLITGPSKTADIEMNLVMGVHGPKNVHVVLIE